MKKKAKKIIIVCPMHNFGGEIVLRKLCRLLQNEGFQAKVFFMIMPPHDISLSRKIKALCSLLKQLLYESSRRIFNLFHLWWLVKPFKKLYSNYLLFVDDCKIKWLPFISKSTVVIYSDFIFGNPLHAQHVIRYMLYYPRFPKESGAYGPNDKFLFYREVFKQPEFDQGYPIMTLTHFDWNVYKQTNFGERNGVCYIIRKGGSRNDLPQQYDGPILDHLSEYDKVKCFNTYKYCYIYDMQTAYASIASVCGCIPILIPEIGKTAKDYLGTGDTDYGMAWGNSPEAIDYAIQTRDKMIAEFSQKEDANRTNLHVIVDIINEISQ